MKKILLLLILLIPINTYSLDYVKNIDGRTIRITDSYKESNKEIIIIDDRDNSKNIKIVNSYRIINRNLQKKIIKEIQEYTKKNPSNNWTRTSASMYLEWNVHNILYFVGMFKKHTISVDFEEKEEDFYNLPITYLQKLRNMLQFRHKWRKSTLNKKVK